MTFSTKTLTLDDAPAALGLSRRAEGCIQAAGIRTIRELRSWTTDGLLTISGCGERTVQEYKDALAAHGWPWGVHIPTPTVSSWDQFFLNLARIFAQRSKDPSTKSGAIIVAPNHTVLSQGYNGFARGVRVLPERYADREQKYRLVVHCEVNAIIAAQRDLTGSTIYIWPWMPCSPCAAAIIQARIREVVAPVNENERWKADFDLARLQFGEAGVVLRLLDFPTGAP